MIKKIIAITCFLVFAFIGIYSVSAAESVDYYEPLPLRNQTGYSIIKPSVSLSVYQTGNTGLFTVPLTQISTTPYDFYLRDIDPSFNPQQYLGYSDWDDVKAQGYPTLGWTNSSTNWTSSMYTLNWFINYKGQSLQLYNNCIPYGYEMTQYFDVMYYLPTGWDFPTTAGNHLAGFNGTIRLYYVDNSLTHYKKTGSQYDFVSVPVTAIVKSDWGSNNSVLSDLFSHTPVCDEYYLTTYNRNNWAVVTLSWNYKWLNDDNVWDHDYPLMTLVPPPDDSNSSGEMRFVFPSGTTYGDVFGAGNHWLTCYSDIFTQVYNIRTGVAASLADFDFAFSLFNKVYSINDAADLSNQIEVGSRFLDQLVDFTGYAHLGFKQCFDTFIANVPIVASLVFAVIFLFVVIMFVRRV